MWRNSSDCEVGFQKVFRGRDELSFTRASRLRHRTATMICRRDGNPFLSSLCRNRFGSSLPQCPLMACPEVPLRTGPGPCCRTNDTLLQTRPRSVPFNASTISERSIVISNLEPARVTSRRIIWSTFSKSSQIEFKTSRRTSSRRSITSMSTL